MRRAEKASKTDCRLSRYLNRQRGVCLASPRFSDIKAVSYQQNYVVFEWVESLRTRPARKFYFAGGFRPACGGHQRRLGRAHWIRWGQKSEKGPTGITSAVPESPGRNVLYGRTSVDATPTLALHVGHHSMCGDHRRPVSLTRGPTPCDELRSDEATGQAPQPLD